MCRFAYQTANAVGPLNFNIFKRAIFNSRRIHLTRKDACIGTNIQFSALNNNVTDLRSADKPKQTTIASRIGNAQACNGLEATVIDTAKGAISVAISILAKNTNRAPSPRKCDIGCLLEVEILKGHRGVVHIERE